MPHALPTRISARRAVAEQRLAVGVLRASLDVDLLEAQRPDHLADRRGGIVGPEHSEVFPAFVMIAGAVAIPVPERLAVAKVGRPSEYRSNSGRAHGAPTASRATSTRAAIRPVGLVDRRVVPPGSSRR